MEISNKSFKRKLYRLSVVKNFWDVQLQNKTCDIFSNKAQLSPGSKPLR